MSTDIVQNFVRFDENGLELLVDTNSGIAYATQSAIVRMLETPRSTIQDALKRCRNQDVLNAEIETSGGVQGCRIYSAEVVFDLALKYHPSLARSMGKAGANIYMLALAGYKVAIEPAPSIPPIPQTYAAALLEAGRLALEVDLLTEQKRLLDAQLESNAPLVEYATAVQASDTAIDLGDYAKMIGTGRTRLFRALREAGVVMKKSTMVYQHWIDAGFFEVSQELADNGKLIPFALITGKGQLWLKQRLVEKKRFEQQMIAAIAGGVTQMSIFRSI
jgi:phage antirepressor YoqD-like protein